MNDLVSAIASNFRDVVPLEKRIQPSSSYLPTFIISMLNNHSSIVATRRCINSIKQTKSKLDTYILDATTPENLDEYLKNGKMSLKDWTYPKSPGETKIDLETGMKLTGYNASDYRKVVSCFHSHLRLWIMCTKLKHNIVILEHDAIFTRKFDVADIRENFTGGIIGLNDPRGATRKSGVYHQEVVKQNKKPVVDVPWIDNKSIPQGLAGNSAYIITPRAAEALIEKCKKTGMWPNDAIMCKQIFPWLQQAYPYYTTVQGVKSSTTS